MLEIKKKKKGGMSQFKWGYWHNTGRISAALESGFIKHKESQYMTSSYRISIRFLKKTLTQVMWKDHPYH